MNDIKLLKLNHEQIITNYEEHMTKDFPAVELKPLKNILAALDKGIYECLGLYINIDGEGLELVGYAYLIKTNNEYLVDYLAIYKGHRGQGLGGTLLRLLSSHLKDASSIILEVEDPNFAIDSYERDMRERRLRFYLNNGLIDTSVNTICFSVPYNILEFNVGRLHSPDEIRELYKMLYKAMLTPEMYEENIEV